MAIVRFAEGQQRSGAVGGSVYSRNRFGQYIRSRSVPVNPKTPLQAEIRAAILAAQARWASIAANETARLAWEEYAAAVAWVNRLGDGVKLTGQQHYLRIASALAYHGVSIASIPAPTELRLPSPDETVGGSVANGSAEIQVTFASAADAWKTITGAFLLVYNGYELGPGRNYYGGPYKKLVAIAGGTPGPVSPYPASNRWGAAVGLTHRYRAFCRTYIPTLGLSEPRYFDIVIGAAP